MLKNKRFWSLAIKIIKHKMLVCVPFMEVILGPLTLSPQEYLFMPNTKAGDRVILQTYKVFFVNPKSSIFQYLVKLCRSNFLTRPFFKEIFLFPLFPVLHVFDFNPQQIELSFANKDFAYYGIPRPFIWGGLG